MPSLQDKMIKDLKGIASWLSISKLTLNVLKTDFKVIGSRQRVASLEGEINLSLFHTELERVQSVKCLGVNIDEFLAWDNHILIRKIIGKGLQTQPPRSRPRRAPPLPPPPKGKGMQIRPPPFFGTWDDYSLKKN